MRLQLYFEKAVRLIAAKIMHQCRVSIDSVTYKKVKISSVQI